MRAGECGVWWATPGAAWRAGPGNPLGAAERVRAAALRPGPARDSYVTAHTLLRGVLGRLVGVRPDRLRFGAAPCAACGGGHGRPYLRDDPGIAFSLAHAPGRVAVAVTAGVPVGVDVEPLAGAPDVAAVLGPGERAAWRALPAERRRDALLRYWVRKEAVLKAVGRPLEDAVAGLTVSPPGAPPAVVAYDVPDVHLADLAGAGSGYVASLATRGAAVVVAELAVVAPAALQDHRVAPGAVVSRDAFAHAERAEAG